MIEATLAISSAFSDYFIDMCRKRVPADVGSALIADAQYVLGTL